LKSAVHIFDASSIIHGWDNYPQQQFPPFWDWIESQITSQNLAMPRKAFDEVKGRCPDCWDWLKARSLLVIPVSPEILAEAVRIKSVLGISNDQYHPKGVSENDIFIIATARVTGMALVSNEALQPVSQRIPSKCKIPAVCNMPAIGVRCVSLIKYIRESGGVFG
jgi:hypothetical protein